MYREKDYLAHYGVLGMKWGHRKKQPLPVSDTRRNYDRTKSAYKKAKKQYSNTIDAATKIAKKKSQYEEAKAVRNVKYQKNYQKVTANSTIGEKLTYNNATRRKAAKYMTDNNMRMDQAKSKASAEARRNTGIMLGIYGGLTVASLIAQSRGGYGLDNMRLAR